MAEKRLSGRNAAIAEMLSDGEKLKNYYRFIAQNPHINLRDACHIILARPDATVCFSYDEWNALGRQVKRGAKSIAYYDYDGNIQYAFDLTDTRGDTEYQRHSLSLDAVLIGLNELNGTDYGNENVSEFEKVHRGVNKYFQNQDLLSDNEQRKEWLVEGVSYLIYAKTSFPKDEDITLWGLQYSYKENSEFVKEIYIQAQLLTQEIEDAYKNKQTQVEIIDDTEEDTVSDEPITPVGATEEVVEEPNVELPDTVTPLYKKYVEAQKLKPDAVVVYRLGDFYEVMGENAKAVAQELDLTLTGRNVGLPERVPMCGVPYHAMDRYLDKILENHSVLLVDGEEAPKFILSKAEALEQSKKPQLEEIKDDEPTPFDDEQSDTDDDWRNELAEELWEIEDEQSDIETNEAEDEEEADEDEETSEDYEDSDETDDDDEEEEKPPKENRPAQKKEEKGIKDRKRKEKPQPTLFDLTESQEKSREEQLIENELKRGSHVAEGKFRIFDKYNENPTAQAFITFLKREYGIGGSFSDDIDEMHDGKGIRIKFLDKANPENSISINLKWNDVANRIADLIDDDNYLTEQEKKKYVDYKIEQNRLRERRLEQERQYNEAINKYIFGADSDRKQRILDEYAKTTELTTFVEFLKNDYGTNEVTANGCYLFHNEMGLWINKGDSGSDYLNRKYIKWEEFADKVCTLIENDRYIEQPEETLTDEQKIAAIVDNFVKEGTEKTTDGKWIVYFKDYKEDEQFVREHKYEISEQLVSRKEVAQVGYDDDSIDASFPLEYCPNYDWDVDDKKENVETETSKPTRFKELSSGGKAVFESYQQSYRREPTTSPWDEVQNCTTIANGIYEVSTEGHGGIMIASGLAPYVLSSAALRVGFEEGGYYCFEEDCAACAPLRELYDTGILKPEEYFKYYSIPSEQPEAEDGRIYFYKATESEKAEFIKRWNESINESLQKWNGEYWKAYEIINAEQADNDNTDLNGVLDQSGLGGAKTRFRNNVAAIRLVNKLYSENRNATEEEKKVLAQFVGWGGLAQAFDEANPQWKKENAELKAVLSEEDYAQARSSTLNAYYTPKSVIDGIYMALNRFGVKGNNRILEPAMGTGNFFGFMSKEISDGSRLYGVELDNLTGRIAAKLYPQANVQIKGFEDTSFPNDKFDIVVGNVPFGGYGVADSDYNRYNFKVHDYFLAKSIDKVKSNGIVAIVTSKGTMDKLNPSARKYVAERAELLGAIRLPNTAFKQTAGTEAVADILFFRKRTERINTVTEDIRWLGTGKTAEGFEINQYFIDHPEMVLGTLAEETGLYGGVDVTVKPDGRELSEALSEAIKRLPQGFYLNPETPPEAETTTEVDYNVKPMCYKAESGRLYMRVGERMEEQPIPKFPKDAYQRIKSMIALREELHHVLDMQIQGCSDEQLAREQSSLNVMYDRFVRQYGNLNTQTNVRLFKDDGDSALLFACEDVDKETKAISKSDVFSKRTIRPYTVPTNTDDCFEALQISKNERGRVDIAYIEELTGKSFDDVLFELGDAVFRDPMLQRVNDKYSGYVTSEEYLSGDVVAKLQTAKLVAENVPEYRRNVEALENVQPTPLTASEISVRLGASWVDKEFYKQFYCQLVGVDWWSEGDVQLYYNPHDSSWRLDQKDSIRYQTQMKQKEVYGTTRAPAYRIFMDCMNLRPTTIYDLVEENGKEKRVVNHAETIAAREKQNKIREEFDKWIFANPERRYELEATYNRLFNHTRLPSYDGSYLKFPEMNPAIELREHQKNAVHRIITSNDGTLLHHVVGSGKTYTMAASIMKMRQLGLCKKAMIAVPNHLVQQWASEWRKLYPNAKLLIATKEDLDKDNRQRFVSKVAFGDWDGIIIAQSSFAKIPVSYERQVKKLNEEIEAVELTIKKAWEEQGMPRGAVKNLETIKKNKQAQLKKLMDGNGKDNVLNFESLGVDYLFVDEAHYYKNLFLYTKMSNVAGISNAASQRASDLKLKCEYLQEMHGNNRGVVFATGTPISNSMTEMYTMQTYLQPRALKESGLAFFDNWAADFGETITSMELMPSGQGYRARTRFAKFTNLPELLTMYRSFADVQTSDTVKLDVPEAERHVINLKPSDTVIELAEKIAERADDIYGGGVDPHVDNMLKVTSDGKKLALDPRCFIPDSKDEPVSKLNEAAQRIYEIWEKTADTKGTQIVFCDLSTPKKKFDDYVQGVDFDAYNELKYKLVQKGISRDEIAFIHDTTTDESKQALFDKVNSGAVRVLIGSTEKCGAGTNVQKRLVALHHLDTPYRPSDMEQREGRIIRQGNTNEKVDIYTYVTERTFDSYSYQILENKQRFISQINKGDLTVREAEDIDETTLSYAEIKAITAANPMIKRKMEVDTEIARLRVLEGQYKKNLYSLQDKIRLNFPEDIRKQELLIERATLDLMHLNSGKPADPEAFEISVNGKLYTDKKEGARALTDALYSSKPDTVVAEYYGFKLSICPISIIDKERDITLAANGQYTISIGESATGNLQRIDNFLDDFPMRKERLEKRLQQLKDDLKIAEEQVKKPFEHSEQLSKLLSEQAELNAALNLDKKDDVIVGDGENVSDENDMDLPTPKEIREVKIIDEEEIKGSKQVDYENEVIDSVKAEFDKFYAEMLNGTPQNVLNNNYKIHLYTEFSEVIQCGTEYLNKNDFEALYEERGHILYSLYDDYIGCENYSVETYGETAMFIKDHCEEIKNAKADDAFNAEYLARLEEEKHVYLQTAKYATEHNEMTAYRNSHKANEDCKHAIDEAVRNNFDGMHLNEGFENGLIDEYGMERVAFIVATTINERGWDGRYSRDNKEWAKTIPMSESEDERRNCILNVHPAVLDAFVNRIRNKINESHEIPTVFYANKFDMNGKEEKLYIAVYLDDKDGEIKTLLGNNLKTEKEIDDIIYKVNNDKDTRRDCKYVKTSYDELLKKSQAIKKEENKEMAEQEKYLNVTKQGHEVLSITKDRDNRKIAIIHRDNVGDYAIAAGYDTKDGTWAQGTYDFKTLEAAEKYRDIHYEKYVENDNAYKSPRNWIFAHVAKDAFVAKHQYSTFFKMPTNGEYAGYGYSIYNNRIKESRQLVDMQSDTRELCYDIRLADDETVLLKHGSKEEIELPAREFMELVTGTSNKDYAPMPRVDINVPKEARIGVYDKSTMFALPDSAAEGKFTYFVPNRYIEKGTEENKDRFILSIPEDFVLKAQNKDEEVIEYTVQELHDICDGTSAEDYMGEESENEDGEEKSSWFYVTLDNAAKVAKFDTSTLFKMPKGDYEGYTYYISNAFIKENEEKGTIRIGIPETYNVKAKNNKTGDEINLTAEDYVDEVKNLPSDMYRYFQKPSEEAQKQFGKVEEKLRKNLPKEMLDRPNWVAITTFEKENGKLGKRPVDCNTGKYASDTDSATWADFDTACSFAKANGMVTLAYALDGKDKIACIDIDGCMDENGNFSELAQKTFNLADGSYAEKSVSGKGLHIFGKTDGSDLRSFSKDGDMEYYRGARFIAVTGDNYGSSELKSFDTPEMKGLLESKFDKRPKITNANKGVEGFSTMDDREVYDRACNAYNGDTFKRLFNGEDLQNNHSNSDMALMNRLAFWCNGDREQMLRMFAASGLYRPEKSQNYYECTLLKALEGTTDRYNPKPKTEQKKPVNGNGNNNGGKR